jgi:hypothetical protein
VLQVEQCSGHPNTVEVVRPKAKAKAFMKSMTPAEWREFLLFWNSYRQSRNRSLEWLSARSAGMARSRR